MLPRLIALTAIFITAVMLGGTSRAQESTTETGGTAPTTTEVTTPVYMPLHEFKERRQAKISRVNYIRKARGYFRIRPTLAYYNVKPRLRVTNLAYWQQRIERSLQLPRRCAAIYCLRLGVRLGVAVWQFRNQSDARCVRDHEAAYYEWTNPTYDGAWQADNGFERTYGWVFVRRWGQMDDVKRDWPPWAQDTMAYNGYRARGWQPWPTYARYCA